MNLDVRVSLDLSGMDTVRTNIEEAARKGLRDVVVEVASDAVKGTPWHTGNNRRSLYFGVAGLGEHPPASREGRKDKDSFEGPDHSTVNPMNIEGAVYSTSGYGGYLETGTVKMPARPYLKPALDAHFTEKNLADKVKGYLK